MARKSAPEMLTAKSVLKFILIVLFIFAGITAERFHRGEPLTNGSTELVIK
jgi:hypothetical protein